MGGERDGGRGGGGSDILIVFDYACMKGDAVFVFCFVVVVVCVCVCACVRVSVLQTNSECPQPCIELIRKTHAILSTVNTHIRYYMCLCKRNAAKLMIMYVKQYNNDCSDFVFFFFCLFVCLFCLSVL